MDDRTIYQELAARIYDLDSEVVEILGSGLGRVFYKSKELTIRDMADNMMEPQGKKTIMSDMVLIGNMARTIPEDEVRDRIHKKYLTLIDDINAVPAFSGKVDILSEKSAELNMMSMEHRFTKDDHLIICISRTYGCGGSTIGFHLAEQLNINYYDVEIFNKVMDRMNSSDENMEDLAGYASSIDPNTKQVNYHDTMKEIEKNEPGTLSKKLKDFDKYHGLPNSDAVFFNTSDLLCEIAKNESFVVMGRCADTILTSNYIPHISIFITAPVEERVKRIMKLNPSLSEHQARHLIIKQDKKHQKYYNFYTGRDWGEATTYDLSINSASYGIDGSLALIMRMLPDYVKTER